MAGRGDEPRDLEPLRLRAVGPRPPRHRRLEVRFPRFAAIAWVTTWSPVPSFSIENEDRRARGPRLLVTTAACGRPARPLSPAHLQGAARAVLA
jgi:hypothetical protein